MIEGFLSAIRLVLGLICLVGVGYGPAALTTAEPREIALTERLAVSFGIGAVAVTLWMLGLSSVGVRFSLLLILAPLLVLSGAALGTVRGRRAVAADIASLGIRPKLSFRGWEWLWLGLLAGLFLYATLRAVLFPMWAWDAIATWGFKGKVFYLRGSIDFSGFEAHNYYPNLVPLLLSYLYLWLGQVNDHLVKGLFPLWGAMLLVLLYRFLYRLKLNRGSALGLTAFFALNGATFIDHMIIAYADLALAYFALGAAGFFYLWLWGAAPHGSLGVVTWFGAGLCWCKYEGSPLTVTIVLAGLLTLLWLRPLDFRRRLLALLYPLAGLMLGVVPWRLFATAHYLEMGSDHILHFFPQQWWQALPQVLLGLVNPVHFGVLWVAAAAALIIAGRSLFTTPRIFLLLLIGGNLLALVFAYAVAPCSAAEFPFYIRGTLDRLLLHITPVVGLLIGEGLKEAGYRQETMGNGCQGREIGGAEKKASN